MFRAFRQQIRYKSAHPNLKLFNPVPNPLSRYEDLIQRGKIKPDSYQRSIVSIINDLYEDLRDYKPSLSKAPVSWMESV